jgi:hypothetical protein
VVYLFQVRTVSLLFDIWNLGIPNFNTDACALTVQAQSAEYMKRKAPSISENYNLHSEKPKLPGNMMFRLGIKTRNTQKLLCSRKRNLLSICNTYHRYIFHFISLMDWIFMEYFDSWGYSLPSLTFLLWVHPYLYMWFLLRLQWLVLCSKEDHFELSLCKITMLRHTSDYVRSICWVSIGSMCMTVMFIFFSIMHVLCGTPVLPSLLPCRV